MYANKIMDEKSYKKRMMISNGWEAGIIEVLGPCSVCTTNKIVDDKILEKKMILESDNQTQDEERTLYIYLELYKFIPNQACSKLQCTNKLWMKKS